MTVTGNLRVATARGARLRAACAVALASAACACAARGPSSAAPASPVPGTALDALPSSERIAASERARAASLRVLRARGVAELRWSDPSGDHFEQGDADLRMCRGRGLSLSVSKLGERYALVGSDGRRWWRFETKAVPTRLVHGSVGERATAPPRQAGRPEERDGGDFGIAGPRTLGLEPLIPAPGAVPAMRDGLAWVALDPSGGGAAEAGFDPRSLDPAALRIACPGGEAIEVAFDGFVTVDTAGEAPGAWPRIPRRTRIRSLGADGSSRGEGRVAIDSAAADADAADRPALYDLDALRDRLAPERIEERP